MDWEKNRPADIVMAAAAKLAEDMVHGTIASVKDIARYHMMFRSMTDALNQAQKNLKRHVLRKKWASTKAKRETRAKIAKIRALSRTCERLRRLCANFANSAVTELNKMEVNKKLEDIVSKIEISFEGEDED